MAISSTQRSTINLTPFFDNVPEGAKLQAAERVAVEIISDIEANLNSGMSPVETYGEFPELSTEYADAKKNGDKTANLWLTGDMQSSLQWELIGDDLVIGVSEAETGKADGHNNFSGKSPLDTRRFLADTEKNERFKIQDQALELIFNFESDIQAGVDAFADFVRSEQSSRDVSVSDFESLDPYTQREYQNVLKTEAKQNKNIERKIDKIKFKQKGRISGSSTRAEVSFGGITLDDLRGLF